MTEFFKRSELLKLINEDENKAKEYIKKYFYKVQDPVCVYFHDVPNDKFTQLTHKEFTDGHVTKFMTYDMVVNKKVITVRYSDWFINQDTDIYNLSFDLTKPKVYEDKLGRKHLNLFGGYTYANDKEPKQSVKMDEALRVIWAHINEVICSSDEKVFTYVKKWICHMVSGRKMKTALYLKGVQGAGKSTIPTFLMAVIGKHNVYKTQTNACLTNRFNAELQGVTLLILEELKCSSPGEWKVMNSSLNVITTEQTLSIEEKGKTPINVTNYISVIITSNDSPVQMNKHDRRYVMTDISMHRMDDEPYFKKLYALLESAEVQRYFYFYCKKYAETNSFNELAEVKTITTSAKSETIIKHLHPFYIYIKNKYVLKNQGIDEYLKDLATKYNDNREKGRLSNIEISRFMKEVGLEGKTSTGNRYRFQISAKELLGVYTKNNWIHELDEFEDPARKSDFSKCAFDDLDYGVDSIEKAVKTDDNEMAKLIEENKKLNLLVSQQREKIKQLESNNQYSKYDQLIKQIKDAGYLAEKKEVKQDIQKKIPKKNEQLFNDRKDEIDEQILKLEILHF